MVLRKTLKTYLPKIKMITAIKKYSIDCQIVSMPNERLNIII